jgi:hypothetical protein
LKQCGWSRGGCGPNVASRGDGPRSQLLSDVCTAFAGPSLNRARLACQNVNVGLLSQPDCAAAFRRSRRAERNTPCQILSTCTPIPAVLSNALWRF